MEKSTKSTKGISKQEIAFRSKLSAMLDDEASGKQVHQVLQVLQASKNRRQKQPPYATEEVWHEYNLVKNVLTTNTNNDVSSGLPLCAGDFLAGVRAGIAGLDDAPRLTRRRSFNWFWGWGVQPLAAVASLALLVLIGIGVGADLIPADLGYASLNSSSPVSQQVTPYAVSATANSLPIYAGKAISANAGNVAMVPAKDTLTASRLGAGFSVRGKFEQEKLNAYQLDHTNRKVSVGFAPFVQMANYPDLRRYTKEASGTK